MTSDDIGVKTSRRLAVTLALTMMNPRTAKTLGLTIPPSLLARGTR